MSNPPHKPLIQDGDPRKRKHDHRNAISSIRTLVALIETGYNFDSETGRKVLKQARETCQYLEKELEALFPRDQD